MKKYDLDCLIEEFKKHVEELEKNLTIKEDDFNFALALLTIVTEIKELKKQRHVILKSDDCSGNFKMEALIYLSDEKHKNES